MTGSAWREYASKIDLSQQFQRDLLVLLPYMHDDYEAFRSVRFMEIERYYLKAIQDGCRELTEHLLRIAIFKLAHKEELGDDLIDYLGSSFHYIVSEDDEHKAAHGLQLKRKGSGKSKKKLTRKRWTLLAMHIYILFLQDRGDSITDRQNNAVAKFLDAAKLLRSQFGNLNGQTSEQKSQVAELEILLEKDLLTMAENEWDFAEMMWNGIAPGRPDNEIIRRALTPDELTPNGILRSYLRLFFRGIVIASPIDH